MARARNIKPGFFSNEVLAELPFESRLLFIGLWTIADRAGRLHDRPKRIKMQVFPADSVDVDALLEQLAQAGFIWRYEVGNLPCIQIVNWDKHQNPHKNENESEIPAPTERRKPSNDAASEVSTSQLANVSEKIASSTEEIESTPADSLIPDSLIPDSGFSDSGDPTLPAQLSREFRKHGIDCQPADPRLIAAAQQGVSVDTVRAACQTAKEKKPGERLPLGYVLKIVESWADQAKKLRVAGATARASPSGYMTAAEKTAAIGQALTGRNRERPAADIIDIN